MAKHNAGICMTALALWAPERGGGGFGGVATPPGKIMGGFDA